MKEWQIENKVIWRREASEDISSCFYPSFYKDLLKRTPFFQDNFDVQFVDADEKNMREYFLPLYTEEIMAREDFKLDRNKITDDLIKKVSENKNYKFMFIFYGKELVSATLFSLKDDGLFVGYRAMKKNFDRKLSHKATVSHWNEQMIFDFGKKNNVRFFSYGKDTHPFLAKTNIGRPLYKIKTGMKPRCPIDKTSFAMEEIREEDLIKKTEPTLFFTNPDENGLYKCCYLYYPKDFLDASYIHEFNKIITWAGLDFNSITY